MSNISGQIHIWPELNGKKENNNNKSRRQGSSRFLCLRAKKLKKRTNCAPARHTALGLLGSRLPLLAKR